ncbi:DUF2804 domain-containing protein [Stigmatella aurantiaca]|uniref:Conserved uncharacterized protein n=2 Tax=Stigmatella aurantiaca (strain DW4/3-1) TaxID=378806 RepID=E3FDF2_STIAD|nr:DUF2804 domain-containing protein [Stigmatella aurantiaca]ADO68831.1 conserved uncharacterized protein [Stigmatella aurantiaca DW4/3-1]
MTPERDMTLASAPASVSTAEGEPRFGTYVGELREVDLGRLQGRWAPSVASKLFKRKRWNYLFAATQEVAALFAVADLGYSANAFAVAVDLKEKRPLCDVSFLGLPVALATVGDRPGAGLAVAFRTLGGRMSARRGEDDERYQVEVDVRRGRTGSRHPFRWKGELQVAGGPPALTVIAPVKDDGRVNVTQKRGGLLALGSLEAGGKHFRLDGGVGGLDYTHGYLARHTAWRWAYGAGRLEDGTPVGLNFVEGFNEDPRSNENAFWVGDKLYSMARARFAYDRKDLLEPWRVTTEDGAVDLRFKPIYIHREEISLRWVVSRFAQPVGLFEGTVRAGGRTYTLSSLPGVTEDQDMLW